MFQKLLNWAAKPAGAILIPIFAAAVVGTVAFVSEKAPVLTPYVTPYTVAFAFLFLIMVVVNYLTVARGFKYGRTAQILANIVGKQFGIQVDVDGVVGPVSSGEMVTIADKVAESGVDARHARVALVAARADEPATSPINRAKPAPGRPRS